jgi:ketosteroid isomerase-like protein
MFRYAIVSILTIVLARPLCAQANKGDYQRFNQIFEDWTAAFNRRDLSKSCALFSKSVTANYQGAPRKTYSSLCGGFQKIFGDARRRYRYRFKLQSVYRSGDLAVARITWYLSVYENNRRVSLTEDKGLDVFQKSPQGDWEIVYYLAYQDRDGG